MHCRKIIYTYMCMWDWAPGGIRLLTLEVKLIQSQPFVFKWWLRFWQVSDHLKLGDNETIFPNLNLCHLMLFKFKDSESLFPSKRLHISSYSKTQNSKFVFASDSTRFLCPTKYAKYLKILIQYYYVYMWVFCFGFSALDYINTFIISSIWKLKI